METRESSTMGMLILKLILPQRVTEEITEYLIPDRTCPQMMKDVIIESFLLAHLTNHFVRENLKERIRVQ